MLVSDKNCVNFTCFNPNFFQVFFGAPDSIPRKFLNLHTFYKKVMPEVGWNKYSEISVEHVTQVVATKKKKA